MLNWFKSKKNSNAYILNPLSAWQWLTLDWLQGTLLETLLRTLFWTFRTIKRSNFYDEKTCVWQFKRIKQKYEKSKNLICSLLDTLSTGIFTIFLHKLLLLVFGGIEGHILTQRGPLWYHRYSSVKKVIFHCRYSGYWHLKGCL